MASYKSSLDTLAAGGRGFCTLWAMYALVLVLVNPTVSYVDQLKDYARLSDNPNFRLMIYYSLKQFLLIVSH